MRRKRYQIAVALIGLLVIGGLVMAQRNNRSGRGGGGARNFPIASSEPLKVSDYEGRAGVPVWDSDKDFKSDHFTFVRIRYSDGFGGRGGGRRGFGGGRWSTDIPSSDMNFSFRLQQLTSLKVNPEPIILDLTDPELFNYPFIYMIEVGGLEFSDEEVECLRRYCLNGGFLMVDDFWGEDDWLNFQRQIKRVFPDREIRELQIDHPIFHNVFDLKEKPQVPSINHLENYLATGQTWEQWDAREAHFRTIFDDDGRMMMIICHNTDLGDGWEREGVDPRYFSIFAEKKSYPMGINIIFYAMTH